MKGTQTEKGNVKLSLFADEITLYREVPRLHPKSIRTSKLIWQGISIQD